MVWFAVGGGAARSRCSSWSGWRSASPSATSGARRWQLPVHAWQVGSRGRRGCDRAWPRSATAAWLFQRTYRVGDVFGEERRGDGSPPPLGRIHFLAHVRTGGQPADAGDHRDGRDRRSAAPALSAVMSRLRRIAPVAGLCARRWWRPGWPRPSRNRGSCAPPPSRRQPSVQLGAELYAGNCATCHGIAGSGITQPRPGRGRRPRARGRRCAGSGALAADFYLRTGYMPLASIHSEPEAMQQGDRVLLSRQGDPLAGGLRGVARRRAGRSPIPIPAAGARSRPGQHQFALHCAGCHQIMGRGGFVTGARVPELQTVSPRPRSPRRCASGRI